MTTGKRSAVITGITGQDGSYLAELLLQRGYVVHGFIRRSARGLGNASHLERDVELHERDITDSSIRGAIADLRPDEVYHLAAQSHVGTSYKQPETTMQINVIGTLNCLEGCRMSGPKTKFYQASTSEMFGTCPETKSFNEDSPFNPQSPYAVSKTAAHHLVQMYRHSYGMFACCGILFNHESPRRGDQFVTRKITKAVARIHFGKQESLSLGNTAAQRDWGHAKDYVRGMWMMLQHSVPDDYVLATGSRQSVMRFVQLAFDRCGLSVEEHLKIDQEHYRPFDVECLLGDASKAKTVLGWAPTITFSEMVAEMIAHDLQVASR